MVAAGTWLAGLGVGIGILSILALGPAIRALLYHVSPRDPLILAGTACTLVVVMVLASYAPARRATAIDPIEALREL